jgi:hypothetical protein
MLIAQGGEIYNRYHFVECEHALCLVKRSTFSAARRAADGTQITDQVDRKGTPCLASDKPGKPAVGNDPRSGVYYGDNGTA